MPRPSLRSKSLRRVNRRLPGGLSVVRYRGKGTGKARCGSCGKVLHGVASGHSSEVRKSSSSSRRVSRAYGGSLCPSCTRERIKSAIRE